MQKDTAMLRVEKKDLVRFKKISHRYEMSMIEFFNYMVNELEKKKVTEKI
jgi:hypothetical protein